MAERVMVTDRCRSRSYVKIGHLGRLSVGARIVLFAGGERRHHGPVPDRDLQ